MKLQKPTTGKGGLETGYNFGGGSGQRGSRGEIRSTEKSEESRICDVMRRLKRKRRSSCFFFGGRSVDEDGETIGRGCARKKGPGKNSFSQNPAKPLKKGRVFGGVQQWGRWPLP